MNELLRQILFLPPQSSTVAREIDYLHYSIIITTLLGATAVAAAAAYFILRYGQSAPRGIRGSTGEVRPQADAAPRWVEYGGIGLLLTLFVGWWVIGFRQFIDLESPPRDSIQIHAIGKQWMWSFAYPNGHSSSGVLYVPEKRNVHLLLSARDVIHSFYVPEFRLKKDVLPGAVTSLWFQAERVGRYQALCTEYCGEGHSTMRAEVVALSERDYVERIEGLPRVALAGPTYSEPAVVGTPPREAVSLAAMGESVAVAHGCLRCHTTDGTPHIGPTWLGLYGSEIPLEGGGRVQADAAYITESMMDPLAKVRSGFEPLMPSYQGLLSGPETGAVLEYIRSLSSESAPPRTAPLVSSTAPPLRLPAEPARPLDPETP